MLLLILNCSEFGKPGPGCENFIIFILSQNDGIVNEKCEIHQSHSVFIFGIEAEKGTKLAGSYQENIKIEGFWDSFAQVTSRCLNQDLYQINPICIVFRSSYEFFQSVKLLTFKMERLFLRVASHFDYTINLDACQVFY